MEIQKQQPKLLEESEKRFQAFLFKKLKKQLQSEAAEKQKDRDLLWNLAKMLGQGNHN